MDFPPIAEAWRSSSPVSSRPKPSDEVTVCDFPEYDIRQLAAARDPLAVIEAHRLNVCLRLAWLLGVRMCPDCPKCNAYGWGCQDLFGSNMRPTGGILGGVQAFEGGTEYQGHGTPHFHGQAHVVCMYQHGTLYDIAEKLQIGLITLEDMKGFQEWFHVERPFDPAMQEAYAGEAEKEFFEGFRSPEHTPLCKTPAFLQHDADLRNGTTLAAAYRNPGLMQQIEQEGAYFARQYSHDAQFVFSRVQHHVHKRGKDGVYVPLNACARKGKKGKKAVVSSTCKHDFPKTNVRTDCTVLICQGLAKKFKLRVTGRRNAYGLTASDVPQFKSSEMATQIHRINCIHSTK